MTTLQPTSILKTKVSKILDHYDEYVNPIRKMNEGRMQYFIHHVHFGSTLWRGETGQLRSSVVRAIVDNYVPVTPAVFLKQIADKIYASSLKGSYLAKELMEVIGKEIGVARCWSDTKVVANASFTPVLDTKDDNTFFMRIKKVLDELASIEEARRHVFEV